ncbi:MAG TPA: hypothetical protein VIV66_13775 [Pyrinomonadaceae bacterium]
MYRPNFCAECGEQIIHLKWRLWTSRKFCNACAIRFRTQRIKVPVVTTTVLLIVGFVAGRAARPASPPLLIERSANSPLLSPQQQGKPALGNPAPSPTTEEEAVYICGARTKKGTPCSRRVHGPVRCWQHKGMRPMLPIDKLLLKDSP